MIQICGFFSSDSLILFFICAVLIVAFYYKGIAALFHYTVFIMLPLYMIRNLNFNIKRSLIIVVTSGFGGTIVYKLVSYVLQFTRYSYFLTSVEYEIMPTEASTLYISILTVFLIVAVLLHRNNKNSPVALGKTELMLNMHVLTLCTVLLSWTVPLMWRVQYYFLPMEIVIVPIGLNLVPNKLARKSMKIAVVIMYFVIVLYGVLQNGWFDCVPYNFYLIDSLVDWSTLNG